MHPVEVYVPSPPPPSHAKQTPLGGHHRAGGHNHRRPHRRNRRAVPLRNKSPPPPPLPPLTSPQDKFFKSKSNVFDVAVALLCLVSLVLFMYIPTIAEEVEDITAIALRILRDGIQILRIAALCKKCAASKGVGSDGAAA
jgi:hypothetical protein